MANNIVNFTKDSQEEYKIRRKKDYEKTCRVNNLVDDVLNAAGVPFIRNNTHVELQKQGVDLVIFRNGRPVSVDEKYATSCWNRPLNTFSFELASRNNTNNAGWFSSSSLITQDYMLVWLRASEETLRDVFYLDIMFVEKETIRKYLAERNIDIPKTLKDFTDKALFSRNNKRRELKLHGGIKIVQNLTFFESPINIIIPKSDLRKIAYYECCYHRDPSTPQEMRLAA